MREIEDSTLRLLLSDLVRSNRIHSLAPVLRGEGWGEGLNCENLGYVAGYFNHFPIIDAATLSQAVSAASPATLVTLITANCLSARSHITAYHMLFEPLCMIAFPPAHGRSTTTQPQAYSPPAGGV